MGIAISSIGIKFSYCAESTAGSRPTTGYIKLPDIKSIPDFNPQPNTADASTFDNLEYTTYVPLLKDIGGAIEFNANLTQDLYNAWSTMMTTYNALTDNKKMWFCIDIPEFNKSIFFAGEPSKMGVSSAETNALMETTLYITPISEPVYDGDPTYSTDTAYTLTVTVTGASSAVVEGANVVIINHTSALTNASGVATFQLVNGTYDIKVTKSGIATKYAEATINGSAQSVSITGFNA